MEPEMQAAIAQMLEASEKQTAACERATQASQAATTAANAATAAANASTAAVHEARREIGAVRRDLGTLWRKVHGQSNPPGLGDPDRAPPEVAGEPAIVDLIEDAASTASEASLEIAALEGRMIGALATVKREIMGELKTQTTELKAQSQDAGVQTGPLATAIPWHKTKQGRRDALAMLTLIVSAMGIVAATLRGAPPPPSPPTPTINIVAPTAAPSPAVSR